MVAFQKGPMPVPITILIGYSGAGKTTLLNRILTGSRGLRTAVLINDFGLVNIDTELLPDAESSIIALANGCVCCQIRNDLTNTVEEVIAGPEGAEYIILEASGVAETERIVDLLTKPRFRGRIRLDCIISVIDAAQVFAHPLYEDLLRLKLSQAASSDLVILNKTDLVKKKEIEEIRTWINMSTDHVRIVEARHCDVPLEIVMGVGRFDPRRLAIERAGRASSPAERLDNRTIPFSMWRYKSDRPFSLKALEEMVRHRLPETVYRCKGVIYTADAPKRLAVLQVTGRRAEVALVTEWNSRKPHTDIVVIGAPGRINARRLQKDFDACLSTA